MSNVRGRLETRAGRSGGRVRSSGKSPLETIMEKGRRGSAAVINQIRRGSLPSWAGGPPANLPPHDEEDSHDDIDDSFIEGTESSCEFQSVYANNDLQRVQISKAQIRKEAKRMSRVQGNVNMGLILSALYAKLLVVMGIGFPLSEVISTYIPQRFYDGFYLYLYSGSILFMTCIFGAVMKRKARRSARGFVKRVNTIKTKMASSNDSGVAPDVVTAEEGSDEETGMNHLSEDRRRRRAERHNFGSFYLRMGAMAFGTGSVIYSGLEFGQYFELDENTKCHNYMVALTPITRMVFTFMQMYFIFLNSQMAVGKTSLGVQFGLMHMIGTNLCVWLNVLVEETKHEILHFYDPHNQTLSLHRSSHGYGSDHTHGHGKGYHDKYAPSGPIMSLRDSLLSDDVFNGSLLDEGHGHRVRRGLKSMYDCRRSNIMGSLVDNASPFLFPCTIEYSLICAAVCYVMWKSTAKRRVARLSRYFKHNEHHDTGSLARSHHQYNVDCSSANKGLFMGIFVLVITIMSLIINLVLSSRPGYTDIAIFEVNITESVVYVTTSLAVLLGLCQVRELRYDAVKNLELDNILLVVAQSGSMIYCMFTIIGGQFVYETTNKLVLFNAIASLVQILLQTIFIIDASKRVPGTREQATRKPGREVVTFLLVCNLAMWLINTLENSRGDSHPVQLDFYGIWAWTIITDISMPLAIFYRFHSTVCLCEVWKKAYKLKQPSSKPKGIDLHAYVNSPRDV